MIQEEYLRIGTSFYKKVDKPGINGEIIKTIIPWSRQAIIDDHGKEKLEEVQKYEGFIVQPSHSNYKQDCLNFYNQYQPLTHNLKVQYKEGSISNTINFLAHIFDEHLEIALDYLSILWQKPTHILPILCLVSEERNTGKTTFLNWLKLIFQNNMTMNKNEDFRSRFNSDWSEKIIIAIDEVLLDKREDSERIKNLSTSQAFKTEAKGKDKVESPFFGKFILCSNNETNFIIIDEHEIRYWVRQVPSLESIDPDLVNKLKNELPQFVAFLNSRQIENSRKTRMWFTKEQIHTKALDNLVKGAKASLEKELLLIINELLLEFELDQIKLPISDIHEEVRHSYGKVSKSRISEILKTKWGLENQNSSYEEYYKAINPKTNEWIVSSTNKKGRCFTFQKDFIQKMLNC